jgi:sulfatase maturation enzyme AslB (radical SAM superfamily)
MVNKNTFCVAPWYSLNVGKASKKITPCCKVKNIAKYDYNQLEEYWISPELSKLRKDLLNGIKNENCISCWRDEEAGGESLRLIENRHLKLSPDDAPMMEQINNPKVSNIKTFELVLGNLCNLKCVMCSPNDSSQLLAEANLNQELKKTYTDVKTYDQTQHNWPKEDDFVEWCNEHLPQAIHLNFTGGEPFIIPWIQTMIDKIPDEQKKKCILHFTTNLTIVNLGLFENFRKFKEVWLSVSVEGVGDTFEYLRYGHKWETLETNIRLIREMKIKNLILMVNHVVQTPSYHSILPRTDYFDSLKLKIAPILLTNPEHFHISSLTKKAKKDFLAKTDNYNGYNKPFIDFVRNKTKKYINHDFNLSKKVIRHLEYFDKVRKNSYKDIIPIDNLH